MKWLLVAVLTALTIFSAGTQSHLLRGSPVNSLCADLIDLAGYSCTEHTIQTKDGYILALQRVASRAQNLTLQYGPPVLLQHGLFMAGDVWFLNSPKESLGFILADHGFDVWVGNVRGTRYSYGHVTLSETDKEFWDWSWQDLAMYDLAEMVQYLYSIANSKIFLVGHSQGTIMSFAALTLPHVAEMVEAAALLCPISYLDHVTAPLVKRMVFMHLDQMVVALGLHQINFRSDTLIKLVDSLCEGHMDCTDFLTSITGKNCCFNTSRIEYYLDYEPHPSSVKNLRHLFQKWMRRQFNYLLNLVMLLRTKTWKHRMRRVKLKEHQKVQLKRLKLGLKLADGLLENIRESVKFVKASGSRRDSFAACVESAGIKGGAGLSLDVSTRWNSTYDMLARALKFRKAFASLKECDRSYKSLPSEDEWDRGEKICDFLKPFSTITTYMSGVKYPTANVYFLQVWKIECLLRKYANCGDRKMEEMAKPMQSKFAKYWDEYSLILAMGAVLDPRLKTQILESAYDKVDPTTSKKKIEVVKKNLKALYEDFRTKSWTSSSSYATTPTPLELLNESPLEDDPNFELFELEKSIRPGLNSTKSNLDLYLEEPRLDLRSFTDVEVLSYWKNSGQRYGDLASLASILLSIPITTVASESAFSVGGRVLTPYRNRLLPKNVQALLCTRNWLRGFAEFEGDIEDYFEDGNKDTSKMASSSGV